jgi:Cu(I)/Ag(I) efflux system membrane fusion protein
MKTRTQIFLALGLVLAAAGAVAIYTVGGDAQEAAGDPMEGHDHSAMSGADQAQPVSLSPDAARRIGVTYARVTRGTLPRTVNTVGFVTFDETRLTTVNPKIDGWVEDLYVDFTGAPVRAGQPLLEVYSPALVTAQEELLLARNLLAEARTRGGERPVRNAEELLSAARRRLAYWDVPEAEIQRIEEEGSVTKTLTLRAPASGIVMEKSVVEGARIMPGMNLFQIADLSSVWVEAEVFERDLSLLSEGQHGIVTFEAYPGETFQGSVTYVYPTVSATGRTGRVRLELANPGLKIKPGMYAQVELHGPPIGPTLLIPRSAVLQTGERSVVFHRMPSGELHPMEIVTGLRGGDRIQVLSGLQEGQVVVSSATFLIDAESNLGAAMAGMAGMDHSGMDMGGGEEVDHSQHQMEGMTPDTAEPEMDHSQHQMEEMVPDTAGPEMDHSQHQMGEPASPDTLARPDTTHSPRPRHDGPSQGKVGS